MKDVIPCSLALDIARIWKIEHMFKELQSIVAEHEAYFNFEPIPPYPHAYK